LKRQALLSAPRGRLVFRDILADESEMLLVIGVGRTIARLLCALRLMVV
jgi:hypothetical protein